MTKLDQSVSKELNILFDDVIEASDNDIARDLMGILRFSQLVEAHNVAINDSLYDAIVGKLGRFLVANEEKLEFNQFFQIVVAAYTLYNKKRKKQFKELLPNFYSQFKKALNDKHFNEELAATIYSNIFAIAWQQMDEMLPTSLAIRDNLIRPFNMVLSQNAKRPSVPASKTLRICYLVQQLTVNGPYANGRNIYSLIMGHVQLDTPDVNIYVYVYGVIEKGLIRELSSYPNVTIRFFGKVEGYTKKDAAIIESARRDQVDVAITELYLATPLRLFSRRLAPVQVYFSMGFIPFDFPQVDNIFVVDSIYQKAMDYDIAPQKLKLIPYSLMPQFLVRTYSTPLINTEREKYPPAKIVFGALCRMEKVSDEYLDVAARILRGVPNSILVIAGPHDKSRIVEKLHQLQLQGRVFLPGVVDAHLYGYLFSVYLETFPVPNGQAALEVLAKGVPVVRLQTQQSGTFELIHRDPALVARDFDQYVDIASGLANDPIRLTKAKEKAREIVANITDVKAASKVVEENLRSIKQAH
jgi:predicted O-linked N-acetylglucosamine transferase (SPINDLY family)